jgi:hypothetical protein
MVRTQHAGGYGGGVDSSAMRWAEEREIQPCQQDDLRRQNYSDIFPEMRPRHLPFFRAQSRSHQLTPASTTAKVIKVTMTIAKNSVSPDVMLMPLKRIAAGLWHAGSAKLFDGCQNYRPKVSLFLEEVQGNHPLGTTCRWPCRECESLPAVTNGLVAVPTIPSQHASLMLHKPGALVEI